MMRAMKLIVHSVYPDANDKKMLLSIREHGVSAFIQQEDAEEPATDAPATGNADAMNAQIAQNEKNLAAFEGLKGKAEEALQRLRDEETKAQSEHNIQVMSLKQAIALAENNVDDAKKEKARLSTEKAECEEELEAVSASKAADEKSLKETSHECEATAVAWENRQKEASAEMAAIEKAKEILSSRVTVLIQVRSTAKDQPAPSTHKVRQALIQHFRGLGNKLHSLAMLNLVSVSAQDPMANVKNLLTELIAKLEKEAKEAAALHAFCQEEKKKTKAAMEKKTMEIEKLDTRIEKASTKKQDLEEKIAELSGEIAKGDEAVKTATGIRNEEHEIFIKTEAEFTAAAEAVDDAIGSEEIAATEKANAEATKLRIRLLS